jgi:hypothetical protein
MEEEEVSTRVERRTAAKRVAKRAGKRRTRTEESSDDDDESGTSMVPIVTMRSPDGDVCFATTNTSSASFRVCRCKKLPYNRMQLTVARCCYWCR